MGGHDTAARRRLARAVAAGLAAGAVALGAASCGGGSGDSSSGEAAGTYPVEVVTAKFPTRQRLGEVTRLRLGVRNVGERTLPGLVVTFTVGGREGESSALPFGFRDPQPGLAQPDRPVWVLSEGYPRLVGAGRRAGAETSNEKSFDFGELAPGRTVTAVWELNAVKPGRFELLYEISAGLGGGARAQTPAGTEAGGSFAVRVSDVPPDSVVTDGGAVVPAPAQPTEANR